MLTPEELNDRIKNKLPGLLGISVLEVNGDEITAKIDIKEHHMAPNGFLHAGTVVSLADTACGFGCRVNLPEKAAGFTTIELKSNHLGTARSGTIFCTARVLHLGKNTQVWDAEVKNLQSGKTIALFRCTQMILYNEKSV